MRLEYQISADPGQLKRVLRGVESELASSAKRSARAAGAPSTGARQQSDAARAASARSKIEDREARRVEGYWNKAAQKSADFRIRQDERVSRARERGERKAQADIERSRARTLATVRGGAARSIVGGLGTVARLGGAALGIAGGFAAASALDEQLSIKRKASQLAISAGQPGQKGTLEREALGVRGFTGSETLGAMQGFVEKTGDLAAARSMIKDMGELSLATSTDLGEMGEAAGQAFNVIRDTIKDPREQMVALNSVMRSLAAQGNLGAVEIKDMVTELAGLGAATRSFEGGPVGLLKTAGAMAQAAVARGGARDAPEATTAVVRFAADLTKHQGQKALGAAGINVFSDAGRTKLKDPETVMLDILEKTKGDMVKVEEILNAESAKALRGFSPLFIDAEKKKKGSGREAVKAEFSKFRDATLTGGQIKERADLRFGDADLQMKEAAKTFNAAVGENIVPVALELSKKFAELAPAIGGAAKAVARFVGFILDNPFVGVGAIVGASIAKDIAGAGLSNMISGEITGKLGAALNGLGAGLTVATMIVTAGVLNFEKREANIAKAGGREQKVRDLLAVGDIQGALAVRNEQRGATDEAKKQGILSSMVEGATDLALLTGGTAFLSKETRSGIAKGAGAAFEENVTDQNKSVDVKSQERVEQSIDRMISAFEKAGAAADKASTTLNAIQAPEASRVAPISSPTRG